MQGLDFNIALTVFYLSFIVAELPSNLALKHLGSIWIAFLVTSFGIVAMGSAFAKSYGALLATRVFLGLAEGGTLPGLVYCLARYYRRHELVLRIGVFFGLAPSLAGAFGGLLASGLSRVSDFGEVVRWRKVRIITTGFGIFLLFFMPGDPSTTRMLNEEERKIAIARIDADQAVKTGGRKEPTSLKLVWRSFRNVNMVLCTMSYAMINISFQGLSLFLPTVISHPVVESQLRTVPPYLVSSVSSLFFAYISYRTKQRCLPIASSLLLLIIGYAIAISTTNPHARYAACFLSLAGGAPTGPMLAAWLTDNSAPDTMRAVTTALITGVGQFGAIIAVWTYLPSDSPNYHKGNSLNLGTGCASCLLVIIGGLYVRWENRKRDRGERDYRLEGKTSDDISQLGYLHPKFRYQL
ncbi:MFS general substrate transporter [Phlegmacium glaucopus]|nr:MFS general substrate transporter [Phlegmacium glaucopus]